MGMDVEQFAHFLGDSHIEIEEIFPAGFKERADVVFVELKERALAVGTLQRIPMFRAPFAMIADANILDEPLLGEVGGGLFHRHRQRLHPLRGSNDATVAESLFQEMLMLFYQHTAETVQFLIPLHRSEICRSKNSLHVFNDNVNDNLNL